MKLRKYNKAQLRNAVRESFSFAQTLKALNVVPCGGNYLVLKRAIAHFDLDTSHFTFQLWNKGKETGARTPTEKYLNNEKSISSNKLKKRLIREERRLQNVQIVISRNGSKNQFHSNLTILTGILRIIV